ncbi:hypothetical protein HYV74_03990 [Candidatus Uhrbacteria bacterium]|nr:hypothetical protein [Candidatus Uhrbacteria bacterium]
MSQTNRTWPPPPPTLPRTPIHIRGDQLRLYLDLLAAIRSPIWHGPNPPEVVFGFSRSRTYHALEQCGWTADVWRRIAAYEAAPTCTQEDTIDPSAPYRLLPWARQCIGAIPNEQLRAIAVDVPPLCGDQLLTVLHEAIGLQYQTTGRINSNHARMHAGRAAEATIALFAAHEHVLRAIAAGELTEDMIRVTEPIP